MFREISAHIVWGTQTTNVNVKDDVNPHAGYQSLLFSVVERQKLAYSWQVTHNGALSKVIFQEAAEAEGAL